MHDLTTRESFVGQIARRTRVVSARDIELFTEMTGDRNPLHYDETLARASRFGGIIVQGGVTSGLLNAIVAEDLPYINLWYLDNVVAFRPRVQGMKLNPSGSFEFVKTVELR